MLELPALLMAKLRKRFTTAWGDVREDEISGFVAASVHEALVKQPVNLIVTENEGLKERVFNQELKLRSLEVDRVAGLRRLDAVIEHFTGERGFAYLDMSLEELLSRLEKR